MSTLKQVKALADIVAMAKRTRDKDRAYSRAKADADGIVGWGADNPMLRTTQAHNMFLRWLCDEIGY